MFTISKTFEICYSHRVYTQDVDPQLSLDSLNPCRRLHGHNAHVSLTIGAKDLDSRGFVLDYKELNFFKKFINEWFDHKTILGVEDPWFNMFKDNLPGYERLDYSYENLGKVLVKDESKLHVYNFWNSFTITPFVPTSERLAQYLEGYVKSVLGSGYSVIISFSETPSSVAQFLIGDMLG